MQRVPSKKVAMTPLITPSRPSATASGAELEVVVAATESASVTVLSLPSEGEDVLAAERMDYTPVPSETLAAPDLPPESWASDPGNPAGF